MVQVHVSVDPISTYHPLRLMPSDELFRKILAANNINDLVGIVYHPTLFPATYLPIVRNLIEIVASDSISSDAWRAALGTRTQH